MNFSEYERSGKQLYGELAQLVKSLVEAAVAGREDLPRLQAVQVREKGLKSLKRKLEKRGILGADKIEDSIKDLAGARVILYSNIDVDRFLQARIIPTCLNVHWEETKAHYPSVENEGIKYEGFHYVVSLPDEMIAKPEYEKLKGLRCEIQIQTLLAHAFAETSHDIIYKDDDLPGFGGKAMEAMRDRLNKTMDEHLKPAGFELDKVQADYEHLQRGAELFKRNELEGLTECTDNNERFSRLEDVAKYLIPHYDDLGSVFKEIQRALMSVVVAARKTPQKPHKIDGYELAGHEAKDITELVVEIFSDLRYVDIEATFQSLIEIYKRETDRDLCGKILNAIEKLASYNLHVWKQAGPYVQVVLADVLARLPVNEIEQIRQIAITVWSALLSSEIDGTTWSADAVAISKGAVPASEDIKSVRSRAIEGLIGLLDRSKNDDDRRPVISALWEATQLPNQAHYPNELLAIALRDMTAVADALLPRLPSMNFDLWEHIESHLFREYRRFKPLAEAAEDDLDCKTLATDLVTAIRAIRDKMNRSRSYVRYKTLVGFEGVFSQQWDSEERDFQKITELRKARAKRFVDGINAGNTRRWLSVIKKCAATKSDDLATFPIFSEFLALLGEKKPKVALQALAENDKDVLNFVAAILAGLAKSDSKADYEKVVAYYIKCGKHLTGIARHYRVSEGVVPDNVAKVVEAAIAHHDEIAVMECLVFAIAKWKSFGDDVIAKIFLPALEYLTTQEDSRWIRGGWFLQEAKEFLAHLSEQQSKAVLNNLVYSATVDYQVERILVCIAKVFPGLVWRYFRDRLRFSDDADNGYQPIPYQLHDLGEVLGRNAESALREIRGWYKADDHMFQFTGGRLLHSVFPICTDELAEAAVRFVAQANDDGLKFLLDIFRNYRGEPALHAVAKAIIKKLSEDDMRLGSVEILLENTGVVSGEFGMVEAMRERKALMTEWLNDDDSRIQSFAKRCIHHLDNRIATEQRGAEMRKEQRRRDYE
jgi:ppGpp synthetase/RelA/SpoT-type nucleotidyltranferase